MSGLSRTSYQRIPAPQGMTGQQASTVYDSFYGNMPVPATQYATAGSALQSRDYQPSVRTAAANATIVQRANRRNGMLATGGFQTRKVTTPQVMDPPDSSKFQDWLIGPQVNYSQNNGWYIAYPAATVMFGGQHNLALSERVPQIPTRTTGGPGPGSMRQAPRFKAVQTVPRYSTMPPTYNTAGTSA